VVALGGLAAGAPTLRREWRPLDDPGAIANSTEVVGLPPGTAEPVEEGDPG
jgi:hypothetical protein